MIKAAQAKALDDLLEMAGEDVQFQPRTGAAFPLRVIYGKSSDMASVGGFQMREYEHQFLCRASDVAAQTRSAEITMNNRTFSIADADVSEPAAMLYGD